MKLFCCYYYDTTRLSFITLLNIFKTIYTSINLLHRSSGLALPAPYYSPDEEDERPFICSLPQDNGIMSCNDVPARREGGHECCLDVEDALHLQTLGLAADPLLNASMGAVPGLCVNWNRYYTQCRTGYSNPHKGAINFDNIGYAWIVIFQVGLYNLKSH